MHAENRALAWHILMRSYACSRSTLRYALKASVSGRELRLQSKRASPFRCSRWPRGEARAGHPPAEPPYVRAHETGASRRVPAHPFRIVPREASSGSRPRLVPEARLAPGSQRVRCAGKSLTGGAAKTHQAVRLASPDVTAGRRADRDVADGLGVDQHGVVRP